MLQSRCEARALQQKGPFAEFGSGPAVCAGEQQPRAGAEASGVLRQQRSARSDSSTWEGLFPKTREFGAARSRQQSAELPGSAHAPSRLFCSLLVFVLEVPSETKQLQLWLCPHISLAGSKRCSRCSPAAPAFPTLPFPSSSQQGSGALWNLLGSLRHTSAFGRGTSTVLLRRLHLRAVCIKMGLFATPRRRTKYQPARSFRRSN